MWAGYNGSMNATIFKASAALLLSASLMACTETQPAQPNPQPDPLPGTQPAASKTYTLPGNTVFPEGVAYQSSTQNFFVSSTTNGAIYKGNLNDAVASVFLPGNTDGRTTAIGLKVDDQGRLFVAGGGTGKMFAYDVNTGALLRAYDTTSDPNTNTFINDVALTPDAAYFTDSRRPILFRVTKTATGLGETAEPWLDLTTVPNTPIKYQQQGFNLNGIAATPDGKYLIVVQSNTGQLFRIGTLDKSVTEIQFGGMVMNGDGILLDGQTLYVSRNADKIIVPITLGADFTTGTIGTPFSDATLMYPTTLAHAGNRLLVVNSQFNKRGDGLTPNLPFTLSNIAIPGK